MATTDTQAVLLGLAEAIGLKPREIHLSRQHFSPSVVYARRGGGIVTVCCHPDHITVYSEPSFPVATEHDYCNPGTVTRVVRIVRKQVREGF